MRAVVDFSISRWYNDSMNKQRIVSSVDIALLAVMLGLDFTYMFCGGTPIKAATSLCFVLIGIVNMIFAVNIGATGKYKYIMPIALAVAMAGDVAINFDFIAGAAVFALGHVIFVVAYFFLNGFKPKDIVYAACVFVPSALVITLVPAFDFGGALLEIVCVVYALIISVMVGKALSDCVSKRSALAIVIVAGSVLFYISDLALLIQQFATLNGAGRLAMRILCLGTYYPAQFLLAFSVFVFAVRSRKTGGAHPASNVETDKAEIEQNPTDGSL